MVSKPDSQVISPNPDDTAMWVRLTFEQLKDIKPGSKLAKHILEDAPAYESAWRPAYINALERNVANPLIMVEEDAPITEPQELDGEDGAYVMCWHFIPHSSVIPPATQSAQHEQQEINRSLGRLKAIANNLEFEFK